MPRKTDNLDNHIGLRLKMRRILLNLTQDDLAQQLNVTFQQIQKYEKAINRISASRLYEIAHILDTDITYFFEGYVNQNTIKENLNTVKNYADSLLKKETLNNNDVIATLMLMPASNNKKHIFDLLKQQLSTV